MQDVGHFLVGLGQRTALDRVCHELGHVRRLEVRARVEGRHGDEHRPETRRGGAVLRDAHLIRPGENRCAIAHHLRERRVRARRRLPGVAPEYEVHDRVAQPLPAAGRDRRRSRSVTRVVKLLDPEEGASCGSLRRSRLLPAELLRAGMAGRRDAAVLLELPLPAVPSVGRSRGFLRPRLRYRGLRHSLPPPSCGAGGSPRAPSDSRASPRDSLRDTAAPRGRQSRRR